MMALFNDKQFAFLVVGTGLAGYWLYKKTTAAFEKTGEALNAVNPLNRENVIATGADKVFKAMTGVEIKDVVWELSAHESDRILWTLNRSKQIVAEKVLAGDELSSGLMLEANKAAMVEWNKNHTKWWKAGDHWNDYALRTGQTL